MEKLRGELWEVDGKLKSSLEWPKHLASNFTPPKNLVQGLSFT